MTLSLQKIPAVISPAGNDILFRIHTDNAYSSIGVQSFYAIHWNSGDAVGSSFIIAWGNHSVTFTAENNPALPTGNNYPSFVSGSLLDYAKAVLPFLQANFLLSRDFHISYNNAQDVLVIEARSPGEAFNIGFTLNGADFFLNDPHSGVDKIYRHGYKIVMRVLKYVDPDSYLPHEIIGEILLTPGKDDFADFKIQEYLLSELDSNIHYPTNRDFPVQLHTEMCFRFLVQYLEFYEGEYSNFYQSTEPFFVFPGKFDIPRIESLTALQLNPYDEIVINKMFLSWHPLTKTVSAWQPEKLYYLKPAEVDGLLIRCTIYTENGAISTFTFQTFNSLTNTSIYEIPCGYSELRLDKMWHSKVFKYEIYITNIQNHPLTERRTFILDQGAHKNDRVFLFKNSLSAFETFRCTGEFSKTNAFTFSKAHIVQQFDSFTVNKQKNFSAFINETFTANSGWLSKEELDWSNDFIISPEVFFLEDNKLFSVIITSSKIFQHKDQDELYFVKFEYRKSISCSAHSNTKHLDPLQNENNEAITTEDNELIFI